MQQECAQRSVTSSHDAIRNLSEITVLKNLVVSYGDVNVVGEGNFWSCSSNLDSPVCQLEVQGLLVSPVEIGETNSRPAAILVRREWL